MNIKLKCQICGGDRRKGKGKYCNPYCRFLGRKTKKITRKSSPSIYAIRTKD